MPEYQLNAANGGKEDEIAEWMYQEFKRKGKLVQSEAAQSIRNQFSEEYLYKNNNGNWAIKKSILAKFKVLRGDEAVWATQLQLWRKRKPEDPPEKTMVSY